EVEPGGLHRTVGQAGVAEVEFHRRFRRALRQFADDLVGVGAVAQVQPREDLQRSLRFHRRVEPDDVTGTETLEPRHRKVEHEREERTIEAEYVDPEARSEEHTSELQSRENLVCRLLLEKKKYANRL